MPRPQEIIEFPSVLMDLQTLEVVDEFEAFVRPTAHPLLSVFCTKLTSISQADVNAAPTFSEVFTLHQLWLKSHGLDENNALIVTCGNWDLGIALPNQCAALSLPLDTVPPIYTRWHNIKDSYCVATGKRNPPGMVGMLKNFGLKLQGHHHRGIDDSRNIAALCRVIAQAGVAIGVTGSLRDQDPRELGRG